MTMTMITFLVWTFEKWVEVLYYYWPVLLALILFWPVLVTLIAASVSASAWLFWLCVGAAFSLVQLTYVLYNFMMIIWDVSALTMLKTFAMLRSFVRYYFHKVGDAGWIEFKGRQQRGKRRRTRREWREEVDRATNYREYCKIKLFEPQQKSVMDVIVEPEKGPVASPTSHFGFRLKKCNTNSFPTTSSSTSDASSVNNSPIESMRKIHSSDELNDSPQRLRSPHVSRSDSSLIFPLRRISSSANPLLKVKNNGNDDKNFAARTESCPRWQQVVKDDLGLAGSMLLTTLSILKEARTKASVNGRYDSNTKKERYSTKLDCRKEHRDEGEDEFVHNQSESVASPTSFSSQRRNDDYSSTLKTLLSGIVKRNHLSVDDFLMQDARSVAERGQHSLQKETREMIDRYGEEVERCIDWVASSAVCLNEHVDDESSTVPNEPHVGNDKNYDSDQIMQKQHDELSKRYILFKRMKQNMGHTALMLSGGGAQAMYHLGTIKALVESNLYRLIPVISGTSGGRYAFRTLSRECFQVIFRANNTHISSFIQYRCCHVCHQNAR